MSKKKAPKKNKKTKVINVIKENLVIQNDYQNVINAGSTNNQINQHFMLVVGNELQNGTTHEEAMYSMNVLLKDINIRPIVLPNHVPSIPTACLIMQKFAAELEDIKASAILSLAVRTLYDVKASGVQSALAGCATFAELDEKILSKKESQARDNNIRGDRGEVIGRLITFESLMDNLDDYLKAISLKDKKTTEPEKLYRIIAKLHQVYSNSVPVKAKVNN